MEKMFVHVALKATFNEELLTKYANSIVFIKDSGEIFTHGKFYGLSTEWLSRITAAESDIDALLVAVAALQAINAFTTISDGTNSASATAGAKTIKFNATGKASVTVGADGVTIGAAGTSLAEGTANGETLVDGVSKSIVKGLHTAAYYPHTYFYTATDGQAAKDAADAAQAAADNAGLVADEAWRAAEAAQAAADAKVASVTAASNSAITVTGTATAPVIDLKINDLKPGNVSLFNDANGLTASVVFPVSGVKDNDPVIALDKYKLTSTLGLSYNSASKKIILSGIGGAEIASINASDFIKDGMISNAELITEAETPAVANAPALPYIKLTFNSDGGDPVRFSVKELVDVYTGANLKLTAASGFAADTILDTAIKNLKDGVEAAKVAGVTSFGGQVGAITVKGGQSANGAVNLVMSNNELLASIVGLGSAAFTASDAYATAAQGAKADSALQSLAKGTDGTYVTTTVGGTATAKTVGVAVKVQEVSKAFSDAKGLAEASDVKAYADGLFGWEEL